MIKLKTILLTIIIVSFVVTFFLIIQELQIGRIKKKYRENEDMRRRKERLKKELIEKKRNEFWAEYKDIVKDGNL